MSAEYAHAASDAIRYAADKARANAQWKIALDLYLRLDNAEANSAVLLNRAICHFALSEYQLSYEMSMKACKLQGSLWQSKLILAKSAKALGRKSEWILAMQALYEQQPKIPEVVLEYASVVMNAYGHAISARNLIKPYLQDATHAEAASYVYLMTMLYDRPKAVTAKVLSSQIKTFAKKYLHITDEQRQLASENIQTALNEIASFIPTKKDSKVGRRVGFISGLFTASPVYFLAIDSIRKVAEQGHQVVILSRSEKSDWATEELKSIASEWVNCASWEAPVLESVIKSLELDELFEMAGWTDLDVLKALASKPAKVQLKWVGGQSCTTGMTCFDGFVTDDFQTPKETFELYSEPLISLGKKYVEYTPPTYMPEIRPRENGLTLRKIQARGVGRLGVIANPLKISTEFLSTLAKVLESMPAGIDVTFIDQRYAYKPARTRIIQSLGKKNSEKIKFSTPAGHPAFLSAMNELDLVLDTFPYSGGLTVCEAIHLKIPIHVFLYDRRLFCERHVLSHLQIS